jgi:hypothetical protein
VLGSPICADSVRTRCAGSIIVIVKCQHSHERLAMPSPGRSAGTATGTRCADIAAAAEGTVPATACAQLAAQHRGGCTTAAVTKRQGSPVAAGTAVVAAAAAQAEAVACAVLRCADGRGRPADA